MIAVVVPVLGRPDQAAPLAENLAAVTVTPYRLIWVVSASDEAQRDACRAAGGFSVIVRHEPGQGDFARKVNAAARVRPAVPEWLFQAADDVRFEPGWDTALLDHAAKTGALVIGTDDGGNPTVRAGKHSTHTLIARSYIDHPGASLDGPGTVFSEAYGHQCCDNELVRLAELRGVWSFCKEAKVTHLHPFWTPRPRGTRPVLDATYQKAMSTHREDARLYEKRLGPYRRMGVGSLAEQVTAPATPAGRPGARQQEGSPDASQA